VDWSGDAIEKDAALAGNAWFREELDFELPRRLLSVIASASASSGGASVGSRRVALDRARAFIRDNLSAPPTVRQICEQTGVSWRTLDYAFREHCDMTPQAYLKAVRLDEARRRLRSGSCATVAEAANRCSFWHMGKFAADYRSHFAELPSDTLPRSAR
jgi:AraC family ethanolamine operon transcriptional activator